MTRGEELQEVKRLLGGPKHECPKTDWIVSQLFRQEQLMMNRLNSTGKGWATGSTTIETVADQAEYEIDLGSSASYTFGKAIFVYRELSDGSPMPVPMADYSHEIHNQSHEFWRTPADQGSIPGFSTEKIGFLRTSAGAVKARLYPIPDTADVEYTIVYAPGAVVTDDFLVSDSPPMPEWSSLRTLEAAAFLLPHAKWDGFSEPENMAHRRELAESLRPQIQIFQDEFLAYIRNPQHEPYGDSGMWWAN